MAPTCPHCGHPVYCEDDKPVPKPARRSGDGIWAILTKPRQLGCVGTILLVALFAAAKFAVKFGPKFVAEQKAKEDAGRSVNDVLSQKIVGSWAVSIDMKDGRKVSGTETFFPNGTATFASRATVDGLNIDLNGKLKWRIEGGKLHEIITESSQPETLPVGRSSSDEIIKLTDTELIRRDEDGDTDTWRRINK